MITGWNSTLKFDPALPCKQVRSTWIDSVSALEWVEKQARLFPLLVNQTCLTNGWSKPQNRRFISRRSAKLGSLFNPGLVQRTKRMFCPLSVTFPCQIYIWVKKENMGVRDSVYPQTYFVGTYTASLLGKRRTLVGILGIVQCPCLLLNLVGAKYKLNGLHFEMLHLNVQDSYFLLLHLNIWTHTICWCLSDTFISSKIQEVDFSVASVHL